MNKPVKVSPSVMCCKPWELVPYVRAFEAAALDSIHVRDFDVMDGHYVNNIMLGTDFYLSLRELIPASSLITGIDGFERRYREYISFAEAAQK